MTRTDHCGTNSDETNMVACQVAYTVFHTPTKIARVRNHEYLKSADLFASEAMPVDVLISPEQVVTEYIARLISFPGVLQVLDFADGRVQMVAVKITGQSMIIGKSIGELAAHLTNIDFRIISIFRGGQAITPDGATEIQRDDEVFIIGAPKHIRNLLKSIKQTDKPVKRIIIASGGNIGRRLAKLLENKYLVKVIELSQAQAQRASEELNNAIVLNVTLAKRDDFVEEKNIKHIPTFSSCPPIRQANNHFLHAGERLGAHKVMALINRAAYVDLVQSDVIDIAISPQQATIGSLLAHIRKGDVVVVHSLRRGAAEAMEAIAHGDKTTSDVVGRSIEELPLPPGTSIGAIVRDDKVLIAHHDTVIASEDHVILLVGDKKRVPEVERLFQVKVTFL